MPVSPPLVDAALKASRHHRSHDSRSGPSNSPVRSAPSGEDLRAHAARYHNRGRIDHDRGNIGALLTPLMGRGRIAPAVLGLLMGTPGQELHTREIARRVKADAHPVQRALEQLMAAGLVQSRRLGNLRLWSVRQDSAVMPAVRDIVRRTGGIAERLRRRLRAMQDVHLAFLFGSYASGRDALGSDIDLFIVGTVPWETLSKELQTLSGELSREVNPIVWSVDELATPTKKQIGFLRDVLRKPKIWLVGDDSELERVRSAVGAKVVRSASGQARPARRGSRPVARSVVRAQRRARAT